ncbi:tRNA (adenosine(37)-N6)-dimethylallyltransferase MiaA [Petrachloros mirabilis]
MTIVPLANMRVLTDKQLQLKPLVVILGPTAVGKSRIAVEVAKHFGTEILTADSRQVYRGLDIGADKPPIASWEGVPHRLIDLVNPDEPFNAGLFRRHASDAISRLFQERRLPLVAGGTGLYIRTLLEGLCEAPPSNPVVRARLRGEAREQGYDRLYARLVAVDPTTAAKLHPRDSAKVIRALEVYQLSGRPISEFQQRHRFGDRPFSTLIIGLDRERPHLYRRIEERIDWQLANGMVQETQSLLERGYSRDCAAMKGLGYRHVAAHLTGEYDWDEMVRRFKRDTRRFAKRQMTWFRQDRGVRWLKLDESEPFDRTVGVVLNLVDRFLDELEESRGRTETKEHQGSL